MLITENTHVLRLPKRTVTVVVSEYHDYVLYLFSMVEKDFEREADTPAFEAWLHPLVKAHQDGPKPLLFVFGSSGDFIFYEGKSPEGKAKEKAQAQAKAPRTRRKPKP